MSTAVAAPSLGRVIFNPGSGSADDYEAVEAAVSRRPGLKFVKTEREGHARELARQAVEAGEELVVAAGGDGTVSEVVTGLMDGKDSRPGEHFGRTPLLTIAPLGTGNDLARTLNLRGLPPADVIDRLDTLRRRPLDVIRWCLTGPDGERRGWAVNVLAGGFSSKLQASLTGDLKKRWGPLAYLRAAVGEVSQLTPHRLTYRVDGGEAVSCEVLNAVIANARYAGGGIAVAPSADPGDGVLDLVMVTPGTFLDLAELSAAIVSGNVEADDHAIHARGRRFELETDPPMPFNVDGDRIGAGRMEAEALPAALTVLAAEEEDEDS